MLKAKNINELQMNKTAYLKELFNNEKITKEFKDFINSIEKETNEANSHDGYQTDILSKIFNLFGKTKEFNDKYNNFFNDGLIRKVKAFIKNLNEYKKKGLDISNLEEDFNDLKNSVKKNEFDELFK